MKIGLVATALGLTVVVAVYLAATTPFEFKDYQVEAFNKGATLAAALAALTFIVSMLTDNVSQVDKLWSVVPAVYAWIFYTTMPPNERVGLAATLVTLWSVRLTFNGWRRGFYTWKFWVGEEDYRWVRLRQTTFKDKPVLFMIFNFAFISFYQMALIFLFTCPVILCHTSTPLGFFDHLLSAIHGGLVCLEFVADD